MVKVNDPKYDATKIGTKILLRGKRGKRKWFRRKLKEELREG